MKILEKIKIRFAHLRILRTHYEEIIDIPEHRPPNLSRFRQVPFSGGRHHSRHTTKLQDSFNVSKIPDDLLSNGNNEVQAASSVDSLDPNTTAGQSKTLTNLPSRRSKRRRSLAIKLGLQTVVKEALENTRRLGGRFPLLSRPLRVPSSWMRGGA